jgi:hypothetical protein
MKRILFAALAAFSLAAAAAQTASDYSIVGDLRIGLPGPDIIDSSYTRNPASCAYNIHSSLMASVLMYPSNMAGSAMPIGMVTSLSLPNFSLMNATASYGIPLQGGAEAVTRNLLGLQFGLSTIDLGLKLPFSAALGIGGYMDGQRRGETESGAFAADLGCVANVETLVIEALLQDFYRYDPSGAQAFAGPTAEYKLRLRAKIILDIFFAAGLSSSNNLPDSDFIMEAQMYRFFFSKSLRTGIDLNVRCGLGGSELSIPGQSYGFTLAYLLPELSGLPPGNAFFDKLKTGLSGFAVNARASVTITNSGASNFASPAVSLGMSRFF